MALAAPVLLGTMLTAQARLRRLLPLRCGPSSGIWSPVQAWMVVMMPDTMGAKSFRPLAIGARQLVVQEAAEMMSSSAVSCSWLTL